MASLYKTVLISLQKNQSALMSPKLFPSNSQIELNSFVCVIQNPLVGENISLKNETIISSSENIINNFSSLLGDFPRFP